VIYIIDCDILVFRPSHDIDSDLCSALLPTMRTL